MVKDVREIVDDLPCNHQQELHSDIRQGYFVHKLVCLISLCNSFWLLQGRSSTISPTSFTISVEVMKVSMWHSKFCSIFTGMVKDVWEIVDDLPCNHQQESHSDIRQGYFVHKLVCLISLCNPFRLLQGRSSTISHTSFTIPVEVMKFHVETGHQNLRLNIIIGIVQKV